MPALILIVAMGILLWSQWSTRQDKAAVAGTIESMVENICNGNPAIQGIRWADSIVRDSVVNSIEKACSASEGEWSAAVVDDASEEGLVEVRINRDSRTAMTLRIERLSSGALLVRGWSSE